MRPEHIRSIDDIAKLPAYTSDDVKRDQGEFPPFGHFHGDPLHRTPPIPLKLQTSGGTTGRPRATLYGPEEWEMNGLTMARAMYVQGARPGDVVQIPSTCSLANLGWCVYKACHDYLGVLPLTTGSGVVTSSRRQLEIAFDWGTNIWLSFPEYLTQLAKVAKQELGRDVRELNTKFLSCFLGPDTDNSLRRHLEESLGLPGLRQLRHQRDGRRRLRMPGAERPARDGRHHLPRDRGCRDRRGRSPMAKSATWSSPSCTATCRR